MIEKSKNNQYSKKSLIFMLLSIVLSILGVLFDLFLAPATGYPICGKNFIIKFSLSFGLPFIFSILSIIYSIKAFKKHEKTKHVYVISLVFSIIITLGFCIGLGAARPCPSRRDSQRENDLSMIASIVENYIVSNDGNIPETVDDLHDYLIGGTEPFDYKYFVSSEKNENSFFYNGDVNDIGIFFYAKCGDENGEIIPSSSKRSFAVITVLEKYGSYLVKDDNEFYCVDY